MNALQTVNRGAQYALLAGALAWLAGHGMLPSHLPYAITQTEMALVMLSIGIPASAALLPLLHRIEGMRTRAFQFGILASLSLLATALLAGMPLAVVSSLASLTAIGILFAGNKLFDRMRHLLLPR